MQGRIADLESKVALLPGAGKLQCYERHYAILKGQELADWGLQKPGRMLLVGHYFRSDKPGIYWHKNSKDLPEIADAGCDMLTVAHLVGDPERRIDASCSATFAGISPESVEPPVSC